MLGLLPNQQHQCTGDMFGKPDGKYENYDMREIEGTQNDPSYKCCE